MEASVFEMARSETMWSFHASVQCRLPFSNT